jgi:hypothetical protein
LFLDGGAKLAGVQRKKAVPLLNKKILKYEVSDPSIKKSINQRSLSAIPLTTFLGQQEDTFLHFKNTISGMLITLFT